MLSFFGPSVRYQGIFGFDGGIGQVGITIHFLPRSNSHVWGYKKEDWFHSFNLGPLFAICWNTPPTEAEIND
jgi:hypothetical protein